MKKILIFVILFPLFARAQSICLSAYCVPLQAHAGDTVLLAVVISTTSGVGSVTFTQQSGPNTALQGAQINRWITSLADTVIVPVSSLIAGTYVFNIVGKDKTNGQMTATESIVVAPAIAACPLQRTVTGIQVFIFGQWIILPTGNTKVSLSDGTIQSY